MATKQQVINLLTKQGAQWGEEYDAYGDYVFDAWLPDKLIWDSGYVTGVVCQTKEAKETMAQFWDGIMAVINAPVITK
jgi:hypothetical protein